MARLSEDREQHNRRAHQRCWSTPGLERDTVPRGVGDGIQAQRCLTQSYRRHYRAVTFLLAKSPRKGFGLPHVAGRVHAFVEDTDDLYVGSSIIDATKEHDV